MSDTPRTEAEVNRQKCWSDDFVTIDAGPMKVDGGIKVYVRSQTARQLERELNAANQRIQSLIEERDRANRLAEWKWNLRDEFESLLGTDKIEEGIEAVKELKRRIKRLEGELESTKADRDSWSNQSDEFAKTAADLIIRIKRLEDAGDALKAAGYFGGFGDAVNKWIKVREDKP